MLTIDTILEEIKNVPANRFENLYSFIYSLKKTTKESPKSRKKIVSFAGSFAGMGEQDYKDFFNNLMETRKDLFDRPNEL